MKLCVLIAGYLSAIALLQVHAVTITVTSTNDSGPGSLRAALAGAADGDTIDSSSITGTIFLTSGELLVTNSVDIIGSGPVNLILDGAATSRVLHISAPHTVNIFNLTISNGLAFLAHGAGIFNEHASVLVSNCVISGNSAETGGGIYSLGMAFGSSSLTVVNTSISGNSASVGGGIFNDSSIFGTGTTVVADSAIYNNSAIQGGGIFTATRSGLATLTVLNTTLSGNSANVGGAIYNVASQLGFAGLTLSNATLSGNATNASAVSIFNTGSNATAKVQIGSTILNAGGLGANISNRFGMFISQGFNLSSDSAAGLLTNATDQVNTDPKIGPLQDNGGPTRTHALLPGSPAIDTGNPAFTSPPDFDQRGPGFSRVLNGRIDVGAFEFTPNLLVTAVDRIGDDLRLAFSVALLGENYEVQSRTNLNFGSWESLPGSIPGNGTTAQIIVTNAFSISPQFFRIRQLPDL